ncbi:MAG: hypothetical protein V4726_16030 [Verrucomicrobiota bacterium]
MPANSDPGSDFEFEDDFSSEPETDDHHADITTLQRIRTEIEGYLELGMAELAEEELNALPRGVSGHPLMLDARLSLLMQTRRWTEAVETGLLGCAAAPQGPAFFIHTAFCLHELGRTAEAHLLLTSGPESLHREALYHYNIACYLAVLGRPAEAGPNLSRAFRIDPSLRKYARSDRDLQSLWPKLPGF